MADRYTDLDDRAEEVVSIVMAEFSDMFDNDDFGPFIQEFTHFGPDRYAQLFELAVGDVQLLVTVATLTWTDRSFPYHLASAKRCLSLALTIEVIRHLIRSYVEIPDTSRVGAPDVVRRDYLSRWQGILSDYQQQLKDAGKKLNGDLYNEMAASGRFTKVLIDYPSTRGTWIADQPAERPQAWWW